MRYLFLTATILAVSACGASRSDNKANGQAGAATNTPAPAANAASTPNAAAPVTANSAAPAASTAQASFPENFPGDNLLERGSECIVYLGIATAAGARPGGRDATIMEQAANQWEAALVHGNVPENEWRQLVGSSVNVLSSTPPAQRDAAANWCVENAPEVDPER
jgi:flagellar hook-length control protein FliK